MSELAAYDKAEALIAQVYEIGCDERIEDYMVRHDIDSLGVLTIDEYVDAMQEIEKLWPHIKGKTVVEIGAGYGGVAQIRIECLRFPLVNQFVVA
jgi:cephalosporin hydroxylase